MAEIIRWDNDDVIHTIPGKNIKKCLIDGVAKGVNFSHAMLNGASLNGASLNEASMNCASLNGASLNEASLNCASLNCASLNGASLNCASLNRTSLNRASLNGASLIDASLIEASLIEASLIDALLDRVSLIEASLNCASLNGASLNYARYSISTILKISWGTLSDSLILELMRHDAEFIGYKAMDTWATGGPCQYKTQMRDFYFAEKRSLWKKGKPKLRGLELFVALCKERKIKISL